MTDAFYHIVIPARYGSSRFPGKPLAMVAGKAMIDHVYNRAQAAVSQHGAIDVTVATDDQRILDHCRQQGIDAVMTSEDHPSGTDRVADVVDKQGWDDDTIVVCLQGDEPATPAAIIAQVALNLQRFPDASIATLCTPVKSAEEYNDRDRVKVVFDHQGYALYFSRAPIPHRRDVAAGSDFPGAFVHVGMYAYRAGFLRHYQNLEPHTLELEEKLEQLRALANGYRIHVEPAVEMPAHGVDRPEDVSAVEVLLRKQAGN